MQELSQSERRADILRNLQIDRIVTAEALADEYGVSKGTIYRDMRILSSDYEGIVPLQGHEGGYLCDYRYFPRQHILTAAFEDGLIQILPAVNGKLQKMIRKLIDQYGSREALKRVNDILFGSKTRK